MAQWLRYQKNSSPHPLSNWQRDIATWVLYHANSLNSSQTKIYTYKFYITRLKNIFLKTKIKNKKNARFLTALFYFYFRKSNFWNSKSLDRFYKTSSYFRYSQRKKNQKKERLTFPLESDQGEVSKNQVGPRHRTQLVGYLLFRRAFCRKFVKKSIRETTARFSVGPAVRGFPRWQFFSQRSLLWPVPPYGRYGTSVLYGRYDRHKGRTVRTVRNDRSFDRTHAKIKL